MFRPRHRLRWRSLPSLSTSLRSALPLSLAFAGALAGCGGGGSTAPAAVAPPAVTAHQVAATQWVDSVDALGTAQANESVTLTAKVTEVVRKVRFQDGDRVRQGDVLVELTGQAEVANLREAQAALNESEQQLARLEPLVERGTIPRAQIDTQRAARDSAKARADSIRARLAERVITAPFAGVLGFRQVSDGALVTPGTVIAMLDDTAIIKLDFTVPEVLLATVSSGQTITAKSVAYPDTAFNGVVSSVGSRVDPVTRAVTVRAEVPNPEGLIKPGMLMSVELMTQPRQAIVIPELSLIQVGMRQSVFRIMEGDTVEQVPVRTGARRRGEVEVLEGLAVGDRVVLEGTGKLRSGMTVAVVDAPSPSSSSPDNEPADAAPGQPTATPAGG